MISMLFRKIVLAVTITVLALAAPLAGVRAAGLNDPADPPVNDQVSNERLEEIWARELRAFERLGKGFERIDAVVEKIQGRLDKAAANGRDVSAIQAALDAFEVAVEDALPIYESAAEIVNSHAGFDESGKVTDAAQAQETVKALGDKLKEIRQAMGGTYKALRQAIKAFREANKPADTPP